MNQFNIFLDFYRIIAEMTEEEIVSAIGSPKYRNTVESVRRIFLERERKLQTKRRRNCLPSHSPPIIGVAVPMRPLSNIWDIS